MWFTIGLSGFIGYTLLKVGILKIYILQNPYTGIGALLLISTAIGAVVTGIGSKLLLKPISEMLNSMKKLAEGDFQARIDSSRLRPKELIDFANQFNSTAQELGGVEMLRSDFVNNFSHEFKTPIVSLRGFAKLLKQDNLTREEREEYLDIIISESDRLAALSTNVLNLSKIENQVIITEKKNYDLSEQIRRTILLLESKWSKKELELDMDIEEVVNFYGNSELLSEVWVNLLDNAIKFSSQGERLDIKLKSFSNYIEFKVQDLGCGMTEETKLHIFDKFYQGDKSHTTEGNV